MFMTPFLAIAKIQKGFRRFSPMQMKVRESGGTSFIMTEVVLRPKLLISHARDAERASRILQKAEKSCLISNSIKTETRLEPEVSFPGE